MLLRNEQDIKSVFVPILEKAADYVVQKIWNENRELIRHIVYDAYDPVDYERSGEFKEAWTTSSNSNISMGKAQGKFEYDPESMSIGYPSTEYGTLGYGKHASAIDNFDARPYLAEIIYQGMAGPAFGYGSAHDGPWAKKRDVWEALNKKIGKNKIRAYFEEGLIKQGIKFKRHRDGIGVTKYDEK